CCLLGNSGRPMGSLRSPAQLIIPCSVIQSHFWDTNSETEGDIVLIIFVLLFNYFFINMWKVLYGKWFPLRPTWKWGKDIKRLKLLASPADSDEVRQKCKFILNGIYSSFGILLLGILVGFIMN
ncbi:MAG: hypothetical protein SVO01_08070, partial [Thermotogota bacterium]|nr:hypothetical protein [Thermotogota bacterium]